MIGGGVLYVTANYRNVIDFETTHLMIYRLPVICRSFPSPPPPLPRCIDNLPNDRTDYCGADPFCGTLF